MTSTARGGFVTSLASRFSPPEEVQRDLAQGGAAPDPDRETRGEDDHRVDALPARARPVHVLKVEPQGELIEGQGRADAVAGGGEAGQQVRAGPGCDQPDVPDDQEQKEAPHQVVDVETAAGDVVKRADSRLDQVGDDAHDREREEERDRRQEQPLPSLALEMEPVDPLEGAQPARDLRWRALRASSSSRMMKSVRGSAWMCPWKASVQCSGGHLRT